MRRHLPPLNGLRAFEAAARHLSFVKAGEELSVTPGAVSHQVKLLEEFLDIQLFRRESRGVRLTEAGQTVLPLLHEAFDKISDATAQLTAHRATGKLVVSVAPSFAATWLVPRLENFHTTHPEIDLRLDAAKRIADFGKEDVDLAIRFGPAIQENAVRDGLSAWRLFETGEEVFPVCGPAYANTVQPLDHPGKLKGCILLHADWAAHGRTWPSWSDWLSEADVNIDGTRGPRFTTWALAIQAARVGQGVALGNHLLVSADLANGTLIQPFKTCLKPPVGVGFHLVCPEARQFQPKIRAFRDWLLKTCQEGCNGPPQG